MDRSRVISHQERKRNARLYDIEYSILLRAAVGTVSGKSRLNVNIEGGIEIKIYFVCIEKS